jgi:hypothetical protein
LSLKRRTHGCLENSIFMRRGVTRDMTVLSQILGDDAQASAGRGGYAARE